MFLRTKFEKKNFRLPGKRDLKVKMSMTGPHRDDLLFEVKGVDIRRFGSQGQQRTGCTFAETCGDRTGKKSDQRYAGTASG